MLSVLFDLILPRRCHSCGSELGDKEQGLCRACIKGLPTTEYHLRPTNPVEQKLAGLVEFERATSYLFYSADTVVARLIHDFKYRGYAKLARAMGEVMGSELKRAGWLKDIDCVMGVPLHWRRRLKRGYSQTHELAKGIGDATGIEVSSDLKASRAHKSQTKLTHEERLRNTTGIFRLHHPELYHGKRILLIDDVCTTGGTISSAGNAIKAECADCRLMILTLATTF